MKKPFLVLLFTGLTCLTFAQSAEEQQAMALFQNGKKAEAAAAFEKIVTVNPSNLNALHALGVIYLEMDKDQQAYAISDKGLAISKNDGYTYTGSFSNDDFYNGKFTSASGTTALMKAGAVQAPPQLDAALQSSGSIRKDIRSNDSGEKARSVCGSCYGSGKTHSVVQGGYKDRNGSTQFGSYTMCTSCLGRGYKL